MKQNIPIHDEPWLLTLLKSPSHQPITHIEKFHIATCPSEIPFSFRTKLDQILTLHAAKEGVYEDCECEDPNSETDWNSNAPLYEEIQNTSRIWIFKLANSDEGFTVFILNGCLADAYILHVFEKEQLTVQCCFFHGQEEQLSRLNFEKGVIQDIKTRVYHSRL